MKQLKILVLLFCLAACNRAPVRDAVPDCAEWKERVRLLEALCDSLQQANGGTAAASTISWEKPPPIHPEVRLVRGRCQALTQKGLQCRRNASGGHGRCWQHG